MLSHAMTGGGDTLFTMLIVGASLILVGVPLAYVLARTWGDVQGVWAAMAWSNFVAGLLAVWAFRSARRRAVGQRIRQAGPPEPKPIEALRQK